MKLLKQLVIILCFAFSILLLFQNSFAQRHPEQEVNRLLDIGIEYILNQNYELAKVKFEKLNKNYPHLPLGKIYLAVVDITKAFDYGEEVNSDIQQRLEEALEMSENLLENDPSNIWNIYFVALAKGYKAYFKVLNGDWLSALASGLSSVSYFEDCLKMDSSFYESYVALGTYKFWKNRKLEFLDWLPFFKDDSDQAIRHLELAYNKTTFNKNLAAISLIWIYIEQKRFGRAIEIAETELRKNPLNRTLKWGLARAYEDIDLRKAISIYYELLKAYQNIPNLNYFKEITLKHIIAQQYVKLGETLQALKLCDEILSDNRLSEAVRDKLSDRLKKVRKLKKELMN